MGLNKLKEIKKYLVIQYSELLGWEPLSVKVWTFNVIFFLSYVTHP